MKHKKQLHTFFGHELNVHPVHLHLSMGLALATVLVTAGKSTGHVMEGAHHMTRDFSLTQMHVRDAETLHGHTVLSQARRPYVSGT